MSGELIPYDNPGTLMTRATDVAGVEEEEAQRRDQAWDTGDVRGHPSADVFPDVRSRLK